MKKVTVGHVSVSIYHREKSGGYEVYEVADYTNGLRRLRSFSDAGRAVREAEVIANQLARGEAAAASLTGPERSSYGRAVELLAPTGTPLERFAAAFAVPIGSVTTPLVQKWLDGLKGSEQTRLNFRTVVASSTTS